MGKNLIKIGEKKIGFGHPTFIIAEVGINHNGNIDEAKSLIRAAKKSGADAVKLQTYITEQRVPKEHPVFDILKKCELSFNEQEDLFKYGEELDILVFSTPFDEESINFLESINCQLYKIASFDTVNKKLLRNLGATNKPLIMSTGMTSQSELGAAWSALGGEKDGRGCELALLHCVSSYPLEDTRANLNAINLLQEIHSGPVGYSDHTIGIQIPVLGVAAGAQIIEKHFTSNIKQDGPDHAMSADPKILKDLVEKIRWLEQVIGERSMGMREAESNTSSFRRYTE